MAIEVIDETLYIQSATTLTERAVKIESIIDGLYDLMVAQIANSDVDEYNLDDGQVKIKTKYRGTEAIAKAIKAYEKLLQLIYILIILITNGLPHGIIANFLL